MMNDDSAHQSGTRKRGIDDVGVGDHETGNGEHDAVKVCSPMMMTTTTALAEEGGCVGATAAAAVERQNGNGDDLPQSVPPTTDPTTTIISLPPSGSVAAAASAAPVTMNHSAATANSAASSTTANPLHVAPPPTVSTATDAQPQPLANDVQAPPQSVPAAAAPPPTTTAPLAATTSHSQTSSTLEQQQPQTQSQSSLKSFHHLDKKYSPELNYMLVEFRKLELQLLGAPPPPPSQPFSTDINQQQQQQQQQVKNEAAGSKERREKLHGFILHLEDTMRQIAEGCAMEIHQQQQQQQQQQPIDGASNNNNVSKEEEEQAAEAAVQRLEEHILANLLPVKVRLTRQLAAQRGASRNPATAPVHPGGGVGGSAGGGGGATAISSGGEGVGGVGVGVGAVTSITTMPTTAKEGTFAAAAEAKRKAHERMLLLQAERRRLLEKSSGGENNPILATGAAAAVGGLGPSSFSSSSSSSAGGGDSPAAAASTTTAASKRGVAPSSYYGMPIGKAGGSFLTSRLHGRVLGGGGAGTGGGAVAPPSSSSSKRTSAVASKKARAAAALADPSSATMAVAASAGGGDASTPTAAKRRMVLYAGMAPGSTQISSSINAVSGVHPGLIDEHTAQTVTLADKERLRLERLEKCAARVALGVNDEGAMHSDATNDPGKRLPGEAIQQSTFPHSNMMDQQQLGADDAMMSRHLAILSKPKQSKPHIPLNFNDPSLDPSQQFDLRLQEARWRQRKRRRDRRRKRSGIQTGTSHIIGNGFNILPGGNFSQQLRQAPAGPLPPQHFLANNGVRKPGDSPIVNAAGGIVSSLGPTVSGVGGVSSDISMKGGSSNSRPIEYICAICNEHYPFSCDMNPWWALSNHDCPKCGKTQIPRLDIAAPANAIEYHPALLAHLDEGNTKIETGDSGIVESSSYPPLESVISANTPVAPTSTSMPMGIHAPPYQPNAIATHTQGGMPYITRGPINPALAAGIARDTAGFSDSDVSHTDESDGEGGSGSVNGGFNYDESSDDEDEPPFSAGGDSNMDDDDDDDDSAAREESVEREDFGYEYKGEKLGDDQARRLLVLIEHASTCPGRHQSASHRNVCHSTKYLMLHVRDCSGLLQNGDICPFPWCRKVKHLLYHLVSCKKDIDGNQCSICSPPDSKLSPNLVSLVGLNTHRRIKFRERVKAVLAKRQQLAAAAAVARASSLGKDKVAIMEGGNRMMNPHHRATGTTHAPSRVSTPRAATFAPINQLPQRHARFQNQALSHHQQVGPSLHHNISGSQNPASAAVAAVQSATTLSATASIAAATTLASPPDHLTSPTLSATLTGLPSSLSVSALPSLEEASLELGDISLSTSDLIGLSSPTGNELAEPMAVTLATATTEHAAS